MKNFPFNYNGKEYWYSRSVAAAAIAIDYIDGLPYILIVKRGKTCDHAGQWCLPGGFLDHNETTEECARREFHEETGLTISTNYIDKLIIDDPDTSKAQNIVFLFKYNCQGLINKKPTKEFNEPDEIDDFKWICLNDNLYNIDWSYNSKYIEQLIKFLKS